MRARKKIRVANASSGQETRTLIVGDIQRWASDGRDIAGDADYSYTSFASLSRELLADIAPDLVLSPLVSKDFDVIDLARHLADLDYTGSFRVILDRIPDAAIIKAEVTLVAPHLDFDIYELSAKVRS